MDAMKGREAAIEGFSWGALAGVVLVALMYGAGWLLGLKPLTQANLDKAPADSKGFFQGAMASVNPILARATGDLMRA